MTVKSISEAAASNRHIYRSWIVNYCRTAPAGRRWYAIRRGVSLTARSLPGVWAMIDTEQARP